MDKEIDFYCSYNIEWIFDGSKDIAITIKKSAKVDINSKSKLCKICFFFTVVIELDNINFSYNPKIKYAKMMHMHISIK